MTKQLTFSPGFQKNLTRRQEKAVKEIHRIASENDLDAVLVDRAYYRLLKLIVKTKLKFGKMLMTSSQAARYLQLSEKTLRNQRSDPHCKSPIPHKIVGSSVRYDLDEILNHTGKNLLPPKGARHRK